MSGAKLGSRRVGSGPSVWGVPTRGNRCGPGGRFALSVMCANQVVIRNRLSTAAKNDFFVTPNAHRLYKEQPRASVELQHLPERRYFCSAKYVSQISDSPMHYTRRHQNSLRSTKRARASHQRCTTSAGFERSARLGWTSAGETRRSTTN